MENVIWYAKRFLTLVAIGTAASVLPVLIAALLINIPVA